METGRARIYRKEFRVSKPFAEILEFVVKRKNEPTISGKKKKQYTSESDILHEALAKYIVETHYFVSLPDHLQQKIINRQL